MMEKYSGQKIISQPEIQKIIQNHHFCAFCILEKHIQEILKFKNNGHKAVLPLSVVLFIMKVGNGMFEVGKQSDAQEFLFTLLDNFTQASFGYIRGVPFSYEKETFVPKLFQGKLESQIICGQCKQKRVKVEDFLNLSLVSINRFPNVIILELDTKNLNKKVT
jgi:uncharacterized UBP type Zn finger protein